MEREQQIKEIAYRLWEDEGRPDGRDFDHYLRAEQLWTGQNGGAEPVAATATRSRANGTRRSTSTKTSARKSVKKAS